MDRREQKTQQAIRNAFLALRAHKPLERITVKELAENAQISKATFYLHYHDIYELSEALQEDVIQQILSSITQADLFVKDAPAFTHQHLIDILFSGTQASVLPIRIEQGIREHIFAIVPERRDDAAFNIRLTYQVQGAYYAYSENQRRFGPDAVLAELDGITRSLYA